MNYNNLRHICVFLSEAAALKETEDHVLRILHAKMLCNVMPVSCNIVQRALIYLSYLCGLALLLRIVHVFDCYIYLYI